MFQNNVSLSAHSNYKIGGTAKYFYESAELTNLIQAIEKARQEKLPVFILGGGTNLLFSDKGFDGLVLKPSMNFIRQNNDQVIVGAAANVENLLDFVIKKSLSGLEWAGGLPGFIGGAIRGNAGAFQGEIKDSVIEVVSLDFSGKKPKIIRRDNKQCRFNYRDSVYKSGSNAGKEIIIEATFKLKAGNKKAIRRSIEDKIKWRETKQPLDYPNIGSIFKNVDWELVPAKWQKKTEINTHLKADPFPVLPTAMLIDKCALKGVSCGGAMISQKHPNFIVNCGNASAENVRTLINLVKKVVYKKFGIILEEEIMSVLY